MLLIIQNLNIFLHYFLDACVVLWKQPREKSGVVLVRTDAIGDFVIWLNSAKAYKSIYPKTKITLIANSSWANWAQDFSYWDEVIAVDIYRFECELMYRFAVLLKIRRAGYRVAIQPTYSRSFLHGDSLIRATGAEQRIGFIGDLSNIVGYWKNISDEWYTRLVRGSPRLEMELLRNAEFIENLSGKNFSPVASQIPLRGSYTAYSLKSKYFVVFPGASWFGKRWPLEKFIELAISIREDRDWQIVLCGGINDTELCKQLTNKVQGECINLTNKTTLADLAQVIKSAQLLVCNDTSAVHIAVAVGTPSVCILGGGHYGRFLPYPEHLNCIKPLVASHIMPCFNCNWNCTQQRGEDGSVPCINQVSVKEVLDLTYNAVPMS